MSRTIDTPGNTPVAPEFVVTPETLDSVSLPGNRGGMLVGSGMRGEPLGASILRPQPTRVSVVGGLYLARQIALRAMATGAWVHVVTGRPAAWKVLERAAGQTPDGRAVPTMRLRPLAPFDLPTASEDTPLLVIHDGGAVPQELFPPRSPWQTTMYVLPYLHPQVGNGPTAKTSDLVLLQRLPLNQAQLASRIWYFAPHPQQRQSQIQQLTTLKDDGIIALGNNLWCPITLMSKPKEQEILGPIRRGD